MKQCGSGAFCEDNYVKSFWLKEKKVFWAFMAFDKACSSSIDKENLWNVL